METTFSNRINQLFNRKKENVLSVYFTAGFPQLNDTKTVLKSLQEAGADLVEIGIPYSDPIADGSTIQDSNQRALENGITLPLILEQLKDIRKEVSIPLIMMGYINPIMQYGMEKFCQQCEEIGIDGLILPDLPMYVYLNEYKELFDKHGLHNTFLITPQTSEERIKEIDANTNGFIYMVSSASVTGAKSGISEQQVEYFNNVNAMNLQNPRLIGFGISNHETFSRASQYANGAIIGSAFIKLLAEDSEVSIPKRIHKFVSDVKGNS